MFCSNCGAKIPDSSKFCMVCGEKVLLANEESSSAVVQSAEKPHSTIEYTFHGQKLVLGTEFQEFVAGRNAFVHEFYAYIEDKNSSLRQVLEEPLEKGTYLDLFSNYGEAALKWGIDRAVQILIESKVYDISNKQLIEAISEKTQHFNERYCDFEEKYISIVGDEAELEEYHRLRQSSRGRWVGGGFGIKGALKGAAKASLLNAGSRLIGMIGDGISDAIGSVIASHEVTKLIKSKDWVLLYTAALSQDMAEIYEQMYLILCEKNLRDMPQFDKEKSETYLKNAQQVNNSDEFVQVILMSIKYNPFTISPYTELQRHFGDFDIEILNLAEQFLSNKNLDGIIFMTHARFMNTLSKMPQNSYSEIDAKLRFLEKHFEVLDQARYASQIAENYCLKFQGVEYKVYNELSESRKTSDDGRHFSSVKDLDQYLYERDKVSICISSLSQVESDVEKQEILIKLESEIKSPILQDNINQELQEVLKNIESLANAEQKVKEAKTLFRNKQYDEGVKILEPLANCGVTAAQITLGDFYSPDYATILPKEKYEKAFEWFLKAAEGGNIYACKRVAFAYRFGEGAEKDPKKEVEWWRKLIKLSSDDIDAGDITAYRWLGFVYYNGYGLEKDKAKGIEMYQKGAEAGDLLTQYELTHLYYDEGCKQKDNDKLTLAFEWVEKCADQGYTDHDHKDPIALMGLMYDEGKGVPKNHKKAMELFKKSADSGVTWGKWLLENRKHFWEKI